MLAVAADGARCVAPLAQALIVKTVIAHLGRWGSGGGACGRRYKQAWLY